jgi:hypothetical protein
VELFWPVHLFRISCIRGSSYNSGTGIVFRVHVFGFTDPLLCPAHEPPCIAEIGNWDAWLSAGLDNDTVMEIRRNTSTGWPTGSEEFVKGLETIVGRRLIRQPACRKRKERQV